MIPIVGGPLHGEHAIRMDGEWLIAQGGTVKHNFYKLSPYEYTLVYERHHMAEAYFRWNHMDPTVAELARLSIT